MPLLDVPGTRTRRGVYAGWDGDRPTKNLDATLHEIAPHTTTTIHRHSWDAIMFIESGTGWTEIDGQRIDWRPWDTIHLPTWAWHRHGNDGDKPAVFHTWSVQPMLEQFGVALLEDGGDKPVDQLPKRPRQAEAVVGADPHARRRQRLAQQWEGTESARLITRFDDVRGLVTKRGARSLFLVDKSIGYHTAGLSAVMHELAPGLYQSRHRHGGEAWLYVVSGPRPQRDRRRRLPVGGGRPHRRRPLGVAPALQRRQGEDRASHPSPQLRRAVRHDPHPARSAESLRGAEGARRARS